MSGSIRITSGNANSIIEEEKGLQQLQQTLLYRREEKLAKRVDADQSDEEDSTEGELREEEMFERQSEAEENVLKENAAKQAGKIIKDEQDE